MQDTGCEPSHHNLIPFRSRPITVAVRISTVLTLERDRAITGRTKGGFYGPILDLQQPGMSFCFGPPYQRRINGRRAENPEDLPGM
jgi:hypothetical protein